MVGSNRLNVYDHRFATHKRFGVARRHEVRRKPTGVVTGDGATGYVIGEGSVIGVGITEAITGVGTTGAVGRRRSLMSGQHTRRQLSYVGTT